MVKHHAEHVWGPAWEMEDRPAPKVFSLVGKSASEVRELSGLVCQEGTGTEERVALNRVMRAPLEVLFGCRVSVHHCVTHRDEIHTNRSRIFEFRSAALPPGQLAQ